MRVTIGALAPMSAALDLSEDVSSCMCVRRRALLSGCGAACHGTRDTSLAVRRTCSRGAIDNTGHAVAAMRCHVPLNDSLAISYQNMIVRLVHDTA